MHWVVLGIAIFLGMIFGAAKLKGAGFVISFGLFVLFWRLMLKTGYTMSHMSTYVIGQESALNGTFGDWWTIILSSALFAGVSTMIPELLAVFHPLFRFMDPVFEFIMDPFIELGEPDWNSFKPGKVKKALAAIAVMDDREKLIMIARESINQEILQAVLDKVDEEDMLFEIAKPGGNAFSCKTAIEKINDPELLKQLLKLTDTPKNLAPSLIKDDMIKRLKDKLESLQNYSDIQ